MKRLLSVIAALAVLVGVVAPASSVSAAEPRLIPDTDGGGARGWDSTRTYVWPRYQRERVVAQIQGRFQHRKLNGAELWIDTAPRNAGPEWRVVWHLPGDGDGLRGMYVARVAGFNGDGTIRRCPGRYAKKHIAEGYVEMQVPLSCIGWPSRIRIATVSWDYTRYNDRGRPTRGYNDWVHAKKRLSRWI